MTPEKWNYCPSEENPADLLTYCKVRGLSTNLWLNGPSFLECDLYSDARFPSGGVPETIIETDVFMKGLKNFLLRGTNENPLEIVTQVSLIAATREICLSEVISIENYSNLLKLIRIMAYVLEFVSKLKGIKDSISIQCTGNDLREAKFLLIKENQRLFKLDRNFKELPMQLNIRDDKGILTL